MTNNNKIKREIKHIMGYKEIYPKMYKKLYELLDSIKDKEPDKSFYNINMGKLYMKQGEFLTAKEYFLAALENDPECFPAYYNLYKVAVDEEDYIDAFLNLSEYKKSFNKEDINVDLPLTMLEACIDLDYKLEMFLESDYKIPISSKFCGIELYDFDVLNLYQEIIKNFNDQKYSEMYINLRKLDKIVDKRDIKIEVKTLMKIASNLMLKYTNVYSEKINNDKNLTKEELEKILSNISISGLDVETAYKIVNKLIESNPSLALEKMEEINDINLASRYKFPKKYMKDKIKEKNKYLSLDSEQKIVYNNCLKQGRKAFENNQIDLAINYYETGLYVTKHPIFNYYIGKMLYKTGTNNDDAYKYLSEYEKYGGEKLLKAYLYMNVIDYSRKNYKPISRRLSNSKAVVSLLGEGKGLDKFRNIHPKADDTNKKSKNSKTEKKDRVKSKVSKERLSEKFFDNKKLDIDKYSEYSFSDKLKVIKNLYETNRVVLADKLLKELEKESSSSEERKAINIERQNKVLYLNKAKFGSRNN